MKFTAVIQLRGINPYVLVSSTRAKRLKAGWKKPMPVLVQLNGKPDAAWPVNMMPVGDGSFYLYLDGKVRQASGTQVGDKVEVHVVFDDGYRTGPQHEMPAELATQLANQPEAKQRWDALAPSVQKEVLRYLANLKSEDARQRNIHRALRVLGGAQERFLARDWNKTSE